MLLVLLEIFQLQISIQVVNNQNEQWNAREWEMVVIPMNSGIFCSERGTSTIFTALLA
jgi:hypothetical protein